MGLNYHTLLNVDIWHIKILKVRAVGVDFYQLLR
jgi:hypothetical protein